jgi:hypothetical protein
MTRKFDLVVIGTGEALLRWRRGAGLLDGRWQLSIPGRSAGRARSGDASRNRFWSALPKLLTGSAE